MDQGPSGPDIAHGGAILLRLRLRLPRLGAHLPQLHSLQFSDGLRLPGPQERPRHAVEGQRHGAVEAQARLREAPQPLPRPNEAQPTRRGASSRPPQAAAANPRRSSSRCGPGWTCPGYGAAPEGSGCGLGASGEAPGTFPGQSSPAPRERIFNCKAFKWAVLISYRETRINRHNI